MFGDLAVKLAQLLVHHTVGVQKGETVLLWGSTEAIPLLNALYRETLRVGAHPVTKIDVPGQRYIFFQEAQDHQLAFENPYDLHAIETVDVLLKVLSDTNLCELHNVPPEKLKQQTEADASFWTTFRQRAATNELKWSYFPWVTTALAQASKMSNAEFADLIEKSCFLDQPNPAAEWARMSEEQQVLCDKLDKVSELRIVSAGTDLTMSVQGRKWINCAGREQLPDGEVYTGPVEDSVNGTVAFSYPSRQKVEGLVLTFVDGVVVDHAADKGADYVAQRLSIAGANRLGEVAIGANYGLQSPVSHILFDEKIGGTVHLALGAGYPDTGSKNRSAEHWDLLVEMRQEGQIYADGKLIYEKGKFLF